MTRRQTRLIVNGQIEIPGEGARDAKITGDIQNMGGIVGTWTPTYVPITTDFDAITYNATTEGNFVRYGVLVYITGYLATDDLTVGSAAGNVTIQGLPFSLGNTGGPDNVGAIQIYAANWAAGGAPVEGLLISSTDPTRIQIYNRPTAGGESEQLLPADFTGGAGAGNNQIRFGATYITGDP